jgi:hypothetical protein
MTRSVTAAATATATAILEQASHEDPTIENSL